MNLQKIISILLGVVGVVSIALLITVVSAGDDAVKAGESDGAVNGLMTVAYVVLGIILASVVLFTIYNTLSNPANLKRTLMGVGAFALLALISYFVATGVETPLKEGGVLSKEGSQLVGAALYLFYFLGAIAGGSMLLGGVKKMIR